VPEKQLAASGNAPHFKYGIFAYELAKSFCPFIPASVNINHIAGID
jgi:hypothetical protein